MENYNQINIYIFLNRLTEIQHKQKKSSLKTYNIIQYIYIYIYIYIYR